MKKNKESWYEVYRDDENYGTETIASFDTKKEALDFMWECSIKYPKMKIGYDEWQTSSDINILI